LASTAAREIHFFLNATFGDTRAESTDCDRPDSQKTSFFNGTFLDRIWTFAGYPSATTGRIENNFFSNTTFCDILRHPALQHTLDARTANPTRPGAHRSLASEAYDPFRGMQVKPVK